MTPNTFPSQETKDRIQGLPKVNLTPSDIKGLSSEQIARKVAEELGGNATIDISKASLEERAIIDEAVKMEIDGVKPNITVINFTEGENGILRAIDEEILDESNPVNIGREAFRRFIMELFENGENHQLVVDEWNKFVVGHAQTGKVSSPYETHHFPNVGLKRESEGEDDLRDQLLGFLKEVSDEIRGEMEGVLGSDSFRAHEQEGMNEIESRVVAIMMAEFSNFVRGAVYYRERKGERSLGEYAPRGLAARMVDEVAAEYT